MSEADAEPSWECLPGCEEPHLTPEGRRALLAVIDGGVERIRVMRAHGWPLATPRELIPPAFRAPPTEGCWMCRLNLPHRVPGQCGP